MHEEKNWVAIWVENDWLRGFAKWGAVLVLRHEWKNSIHYFVLCSTFLIFFCLFSHIIFRIRTFFFVLNIMINCLLVEYGKAYKWKRINCLQVLGFFDFMYLWIVYHWKSNISALKLSFSSFIHWSPYGNYFELFYLPNDCDFLFGLWNWRKFGLNNLLFVYIVFLCNVQSN